MRIKELFPRLSKSQREKWIKDGPSVPAAINWVAPEIKPENQWENPQHLFLNNTGEITWVAYYNHI